VNDRHYARIGQTQAVVVSIPLPESCRWRLTVSGHDQKLAQTFWQGWLSARTGRGGRRLGPKSLDHARPSTLADHAVYRPGRGRPRAAVAKYMLTRALLTT
jgi:hypothetical protein